MNELRRNAMIMAFERIADIASAYEAGQTMSAEDTAEVLAIAQAALKDLARAPSNAER